LIIDNLLCWFLGVKVKIIMCMKITILYCLNHLGCKQFLGATSHWRSQRFTWSGWCGHGTCVRVCTV